MSGGQRRRVAVVGASAAGLKCACRLARVQPEWRITVVEKRSIFSFAACPLPYVLPGDVDDAERLRRTQYGALRDPRYCARVKGVEVMAGWRATRIFAEDRTVEITDHGGRAAEVVRWLRTRNKPVRYWGGGLRWRCVARPGGAR